jgi:uncharacterized low-complexity protein
MSHSPIKPAVPVLGALLLSGLGLSAHAFAMQSLPTGYLVGAQSAAADAAELADTEEKIDCGEGKCGEGMCGEGKCGQGGCGQGRCKDKPAQSDAAAEPAAADKQTSEQADTPAARSDDP